MLKINKFLRLRRSLPHSATYRFMSEDWVKNCPPVYECKQPEKDPYGEFVALLRERITPRMFQKQCHKDYKIHRNIFFFLCIPTILCVAINTFYMNDEVRKRQKFVPFTYLRIRRKPYAWDETRTLFHNPRYNALPEGYEIEVPEEEEYDPFLRFRKKK